MPAPSYAVANLGLYTTGDTADLSACTIESGITFEPTLSTQNGGREVGFSESASVQYPVGFRLDLGASFDLTTHKYLAFRLYTQQYGMLPALETFANGGLRIYFQDTSGNYAGYDIYGSDMHPIDSNYDLITLSFRTFQPTPFAVNLDRTPDFASATPLDQTDFRYVELVMRRQRNSSMSLWTGFFTKLGDVTVTDGDVSDPISLLELANFYRFNNSVWEAPHNQWELGFRVTDAILNTTTGLLFVSMFGVNIGDGSTTCRFSDNDGVSLTFWADPPSTSAYPDVPTSARILLDDNSAGRGFTVNQSASCVFTWADGNIFSKEQAGGENFVEVTGNTAGTCTFTDFGFHNLEYVTCGHGTYTRCLFNGTNRLEIDANTTFSECSLENLPAGADGLYTQEAPGDFSGIDITFRLSNSGYDLVIDAPSAGTYDFTGIRVDSGHTLNIRNASATNAITVLIPVGVNFATSTVGGSITVQADVTVKLTVRDLTDNSPIENARVRMVAAAGGSLAVGTLILNATTDVNGEVQTTDTYASNQPFSAAVRKATPPDTLFKPSTISGVISTLSGLDQTALMVRDE